MKHPLLPALVTFVLLSAPVLAADVEAVHHDLEVRLDPVERRIDVLDRLNLGSLPTAEGGGYLFVLHEGLQPRLETSGWKLGSDEGGVDAVVPGMNVSGRTNRVPLETWRLLPEGEPRWPVSIAYGGAIDHPITTAAGDYQRSFSETPGIIGEEGVFLAGATFWVPTFGDGLVTFRLKAEVPAGWDVVSQGRRASHEATDEGTSATWDCASPTEEVYLVAGPWTEYSDRAGEIELFAFLRTPDPGLANKYLQATRRYLEMYQEMLTPYPYASFSLVENFWETGYGMPGFTLLGPRIIRFPWILTSSYPHEILHNWWGNSVYFEPGRGNWAEGLTAYLADHMFAEQRGDAAVYRRTTLKKFTDFVAGGDDVPLGAFISRDSPASEAVGYGKSLMLFHMVRRGVGDETFLKALASFDESHRFRRASFADLAREVAKADGGEWESFFEAWVSRPGAPRLEIVRAEARPVPSDEDSWELDLALRQAQPEAPFPISVPIVVTLEGDEEPVRAELYMDGRTEEMAPLSFGSRPLRVDVDPAFDVMRRVDPLELPPALSTVFANKDPLFVLPRDATEEERKAWSELAARWKGEGEPRTALDSELDALPRESAWILGWTNRFRTELAERLAVQAVSLEETGASIGEERVPKEDHALVLVGRHPGDPELAVGWVASDLAAAIPGLARKLPHYSKYSFLGFRGDEPENMLKGMWEPLSSPLVRNLSDGPVAELVLTPPAPLAELPPAFDAAAMSTIVSFLAAPEQKGRGVGSPGLERATRWVEQRFRETGLKPAGEEGFRQSWSWTGGEPSRSIELTNLLARIPGTDGALDDRPVLVLAHLDHLGTGWPDVREGNEGRVHPGADDNASGVAILLEVARVMASNPPGARPVLFAVVTGEEAGRVGSKHLLESLKPARLPFACVNLDTVGRLSEGKLHVLDSDSAREWRFIFMGVQYTTGLASTLVAEPLDSSDQVSCLEHGVPAVQLFTGPHGDYHRPGDTPDKVDLEGMTRLAEAVNEIVAYLAERTDPLTVTIAGAEGAGEAPSAPSGDRTTRRVSLGTVPDFSFSGPGVRVQEVLTGSAAEAAGLEAGDVLVAMDDEEIANLRGYSDLLKRHEPGDEVELTVVRGEQRLTVRVTLKAR